MFKMAFDPPSPHFRKNILQFLSKKRSSLKVQNLQYKFWYWQWPHPAFGTFPKFHPFWYPYPSLSWIWCTAWFLHWRSVLKDLNKCLESIEPNTWSHKRRFLKAWNVRRHSIIQTRVAKYRNLMVCNDCLGMGVAKAETNCVAQPWTFSLWCKKILLFLKNCSLWLQGTYVIVTMQMHTIITDRRF